MKKAIFILGALITILSSCKKERDGGSVLPNVNNLFYYDFVPDIVATVPRNDTLSYYLDVNNDSIYDMKFFLFNTTTVVAHQEEVEYSIRVSKIDSLNFLLKDLYCNGPCQPSIDSGIYIKKTDMIENELYLELNNYQAFIHCHCFISKKYVGFKLIKNGEEYLGWVRFQAYRDSLIIDDYALRLTSNDSLCIGSH
ncbi:MAG: hypothetical protein KA285_03045 [Bacteroidia bacterium]|nr:hypothetical protein [Bacteroidia bacterium]